MMYHTQGLVKGEKFCFVTFIFDMEKVLLQSIASQLTSPASQKSKDINKVPLLLQDLGLTIKHSFVGTYNKSRQKIIIPYPTISQPKNPEQYEKSSEQL